MTVSQIEKSFKGIRDSLEFVFENLDAMSYSNNEIVQNFVKNLKLPRYCYAGAMNMYDLPASEILMQNSIAHFGYARQSAMALFNTIVMQKVISNNDAIRINDNIVRIADTKEGIFANIMNDLAFCKYAKQFCQDDKLGMMTYAYLRRSAAFGLYAQGIINRQILDYTQDLWKQIAIKTDPGIDFQVKAGEVANFIFWLYDERFKDNFIQLLSTTVAKDRFPKTQGDGYIDDEDVIEIILSQY